MKSGQFVEKDIRSSRLRVHLENWNKRLLELHILPKYKHYEMASEAKCPEKLMPITPNAGVASTPPEALPRSVYPPPYSAAAPIGFIPTGFSGQSDPPSYAYATESTTFLQQPAQHTVVREVLLVESPRHQHRRRSPLGLLAKIVNQGHDSRHSTQSVSECNCQHQEGCVHHESNGHLEHHKHHRGHRGHRGHRYH